MYQTSKADIACYTLKLHCSKIYHRYLSVWSGDILSKRNWLHRIRAIIEENLSFTVQ